VTAIVVLVRHIEGETKVEIVALDLLAELLDVDLHLVRSLVVVLIDIIGPDAGKGKGDGGDLDGIAEPAERLVVKGDAGSLQFQIAERLVEALVEIGDLFHEPLVHESLAITGEHQAVAAIVTGERKAILVIPLVKVPEAEVLFDLVAIVLFMHLGDAKLAVIGATSGNRD